MFPSNDTMKLAQFLLRHFDEKPCDWLYPIFVESQPLPCQAEPEKYPLVKHCREEIRTLDLHSHRPRGPRHDICFHRGRFSSLPGKVLDDGALLWATLLLTIEWNHSTCFSSCTCPSFVHCGFCRPDFWLIGGWRVHYTRAHSIFCSAWKFFWHGWNEFCTSRHTAEKGHQVLKNTWWQIIGVEFSMWTYRVLSKCGIIRFTQYTHEANGLDEEFFRGHEARTESLKSRICALMLVLNFSCPWHS